MKRVFLLGLAISLITIAANAQEKISSYLVDTFNKGELSVMATEPKENGTYTLYIDVPPLRDSRQVALIIKDKHLADFKNNILNAKEVFLDWKKTAIENKVIDVEKEIQLNKGALGAAFVYGSWNFDFDIILEAQFRVREGKHYLVLTNKHKLQSSSNRYIDSDGFALLFSDEKEIDEFLESLDPQIVMNHFTNKKSKEDIFTQN